jgi:iron complex transport system substrate-binding protein
LANPSGNRAASEENVLKVRATAALRKSSFVALVLVFCGAALQGQNAPANVPTAPSIASPAAPVHEVKDEYGRTVRVPQLPERIISLAPSLTETIYALGAQDRLVGDTDYCDYPPDAQKKAKVGGAKNPNLEEIVSLHPDLVLVTKEINRIETLQALDTLGVTTYATTDAHNIDDIMTTTQRLGDLVGAQEAGKTVSADMAARLDALHTKLETVPPTRVLFVVWTEPLISIGKNTFIADALRRAGASSVVETTNDWPQISLEEVVRLQPEYLVFAESHTDAGVRDFDAIATRPGWRLLNAVQNRHFAVISDAVNRPAPRIVSAIEELARELHPSAFAEPAPAAKVPVEKQPVAPPATPDAAPGNNAPPHAVGAIAASRVEMACAR